MMVAVHLVCDVICSVLRWSLFYSRYFWITLYMKWYTFETVYEQLLNMKLDHDSRPLTHTAQDSPHCSEKKDIHEPTAASTWTNTVSSLSSSHPFYVLFTQPCHLSPNALSLTEKLFKMSQSNVWIKSKYILEVKEASVFSCLIWNICSKNNVFEWPLFSCHSSFQVGGRMGGKTWGSLGNKAALWCLSPICAVYLPFYNKPAFLCMNRLNQIWSLIFSLH